MLVIIFSILLIIANIYCFMKRKYLYLFIPCMLFLPTYYGIDIHPALPIISATRIMFIIFFIYAFINRRRDINLSSYNLKTLPREYKYLIGYFALRLISNLYYATTYGQAVKTIFVLIFEQLLLFIACYLLNPTKDEVLKLLDIVVSTATFFFIIGISESFTSIRPFDALFIANRPMLNEHYTRLGLLRATTTFLLPGVFGNMCILILPLILYLNSIYHKKKYLFSIGLCILAIIHSGSRSDMLYFCIIITVYAVFVLRSKEQRFQLLKNALCIFVGLSIFISIASISNPYYKYFYVTSGKAVLNEIGFEFDLSEGSPSSNVDFGANSIRGSATRLSQFSGILYTSKINPIFGLGSGAQVRGDLKYYWLNDWRVYNTYDVGLVEIFGDEGLLGLLGLCLLIICFYRLCKFDRHFILLLLAYLLSTFSTANMYSFLIFYVIVLFLLNNEGTSYSS